MSVVSRRTTSVEGTERLGEAFGAALRAQFVRHNPLMRGFSFGAMMGIMSLMIHSTVDFNLQIPANALTFMLLLAFAWVMSGWLVHLRRESGEVAGWLALWCVSTSAPMLQFATRSYWLIALAFGPFVYAWTRHRSDRAGRTALAVGAMVLVKSLCGYEYLSSILGGAMVAVWHREREAGHKFGAWRDVGWWQLALQEERGNPPEPIGARALEATAEWREALAAGARLLSATA